MKKILIIFFIMASIFSDCKKDSPKDPPPFLNTVWTLSYIQNVSTKLTFNFPSDANNKITLVFADDGKVVFNGICNTGSGDFTFVPLDNILGTLTVTDLVTTKIACSYVEWEGYTTQSLGKAYKYLITGSSISITTTGDFNLFLINE